MFLYKEKIVALGDGEDFVESLCIRLLNEGFSVEKVSYGPDMIDTVLEKTPDLIIISMLSPGQNGIEVCIKLRESLNNLIFILSGKSSDQDKIIGLSVGADEYITIPVSISVLIAQINACFRRCRLQTHPEGITAKSPYLVDYQDLKIDINSRTVIVNHHIVSLTAIEFDILVLLAENPNRVFYTSQIFNNIWDTNSILQGDDKTVTVHISNLRKKVETDPIRPKYIITVRGVGYKFAAPEGK